MGVRRYQNEDGTLTEEGKARYEQLSDKDKTVYNNLVESKKGVQSVYEKNKAQLKKFPNNKRLQSAVAAAKKDLDSFDNAMESILGGNTKKQRAEAGKSMTKEQSLQKVDAAQRARTVGAVLAVAGGVVLAGATVYTIKKRGADALKDRTIFQGTSIQNLSRDPNRDMNQPFYAAYKNRDKKLYEGMFGGDVLMRGKKATGDATIYSAKAAKNLNIAGADTGRKVAEGLIKNDSEYRETLQKIVDEPVKGMKRGYREQGFYEVKTFLERLKNHSEDSGEPAPVLGKEGYKWLNWRLVDHTENQQKLTDKFYAKLKESGYSGVLDTNDKLQSQYRARSDSPVILFEGESVLKNATRRTESKDYFKPKVAKEAVKLNAAAAYNREGKKIGAGLAAVGVGTAAVGTAMERKAIREYRKEHPNSKLSDKEILAFRIRKG